MKDDKIVFFGLGTLGGAMARRLAATGHRVYGFDPSEKAVEKALSAGVKKGAAADLADCRYIVSSLPNDPVVNQVLAGPDGALAKVPKSVTLIELSTILPSTIKSLSELAGRNGCSVVDGTISGGPNEADKGTLKVLVGCSTDRIPDPVADILKDLGDVLHVGKVGDSKTIKLVNNIMSMCNVAAAAEAFALGVKAGIEPKKLFDILSQSGGSSHHFVKRFPNVLADNFKPGFSTAMGEKDLRLAVEMAHEIGSPLFMSAVAHQIYERTCQVGFKDDDIISVIKIMR